WPNGDEVIYTEFRNGQGNPPDFRWDSHMGEMVLDSTTVPGLQPGDLRFVKMDRDQAGDAYTKISDEQSPITLAGSTLLYTHWGSTDSVLLTDRSPSLGLTYASPITTTNHPSVIRQMQACSDFVPS